MNQKAVRELAKKYLPVAWLCLLCVPPTNVCADVVNGIDILSHNYAFMSPWQWSWRHDIPQSTMTEPYSSDSGSYYPNNTFAGSRWTTTFSSAGPFPPGLGPGISGGATFDTFLFQNGASAILSGDRYHGSDGQGYGYWGEIKTQTQADWDFRPTTDTMQVALHISSQSQYLGFQGLAVYLTDVTPPHYSTLLSFDENATRDGTIDVTNTFAVNPVDTYELEVTGWSDTFSDDYMGQSVTASIQAIPEPGELPLLGLGGLAGGALTIYRRRRPIWSRE